MSDYSEHLISMAGGDGETVDQVHAQFERIAFPETPEERDAAESKILALVREQAAKLAAVTTILDDWATHKAFPDAEESQRWYSLGKRHAADRIRTALEPTP